MQLVVQLVAIFVLFYKIYVYLLMVISVYKYFFLYFQKRLREGTLLCEKAIRIVNQLELFSRNEDIDEVSTNEIK